MTSRQKAIFLFVSIGAVGSLPIMTFMKLILRLDAFRVLPVLVLPIVFISSLIALRYKGSSSKIVQGAFASVLSLFLCSLSAGFLFHEPGLRGLFWALLGFSVYGLTFFGWYAAALGALSGFLCIKWVGVDA